MSLQVQQDNPSTRPISFYWLGSQLSAHAIISIKSFLAYGHECHLYTDSDIKNIPDGVIIKAASSILPFNDALIVKEGFGSNSPAPFADLFRFTLLQMHGGIWADLDVVCLKPWSNLPPRFIASSLESHQCQLPNINVVGLRKDDPFATEWIHTFNTTRNASDYAYGVVAANIALAKCGNKPLLVPSRWFNPVSYRNTSYLISKSDNILSLKRLKRFIRYEEPLNIPVPRQAYGLHLWSQMWKLNNWSQEKRYPLSTLYGQLQERYL